MSADNKKNWELKNPEEDDNHTISLLLKASEVSKKLGQGENVVLQLPIDENNSFMQTFQIDEDFKKLKQFVQLQTQESFRPNQIICGYSQGKNGETDVWNIFFVHTQ